ncbi:MAG: phage recombination protein Bet [Bacteroides sp.]|nr:phage recombination protein Bet [Bacteroides sp.]
MERQQNGAAEQAAQTAVATTDRAKTTFMVAGKEITLSYQIVRDFLVKGDGKVSDQDLSMFISICRYNELNPFLSEAYLVKYGTSPAQMIVSKEAFFKRAEQCEHYQGFQCGVIVERNGEVVDLEGGFYLPTDKLRGAWCNVYRDDRKFPIVARVRLEEYTTGKSTWNTKPGTMITKVAKVQALREAFPTQLGAMYTIEESDVKDVPYEDVTEKVNREIEANANKGTVSFEEPAPEAAPEPAAAPAPAPAAAPASKQQRVPGF